MAYDKDAVLSVVYDRMCDGESVEAICQTEGMPDARTIYRWLVDDEKCQEYARAKAVRAERYAQKVIDIAESKDIKPDDKRVRIDAYKWAAGKLSGKYSDKVKHVGGDDGDNPILIKRADDLTDDELAAIVSK